MKHVSTLLSNLEAQHQAEREQIEALTRSEYEHLRNALSDLREHELNTIEDDMQASLERLNAQVNTALNESNRSLHQGLEKALSTLIRISQLTTRQWLKLVLISLSLLLGISLGSWGLMQYLSSQVQDLWSEQQRLSASVEQLEARTWGVSLLRSGQDRFVVLPGRGGEPNWKCNDNKNPCIKLK